MNISLTIDLTTEARTAEVTDILAMEQARSTATVMAMG